MGKRFTFTLALLLAAGCATSKNTGEQPVTAVTVKVPVAQARAVPPALKEPLFTAADLPTYVLPNDPLATSALTKEGEDKQRTLIERLLDRLAAWEAWASE